MTLSGTISLNVETHVVKKSGLQPERLWKPCILILSKNHKGPGRSFQVKPKTLLSFCFPVSKFYVRQFLLWWFREVRSPTGNNKNAKLDRRRSEQELGNVFLRIKKKKKRRSDGQGGGVGRHVML